jgi:hypothetical protein
VIENYFKRFNYRLNLDHNIGAKMTVGATLNTAFGRNRRSFNDNTYQAAVRLNRRRATEHPSNSTVYRKNFTLHCIAKYLAFK